MRRFELVCRGALGATLWAVAACYSYATVPPSGAKIGEHVRVRVSGAQADRLEPVLGSTERKIEGELLEQADTSITVAVTLPAPAQASALGERTQQRIIILRAGLQEMELRRLNKLRTSLLVGAAVAGVAVIAASTGSSLLGSGGSGGPPNESRVPRTIPLASWSLAVPWLGRREEHSPHRSRYAPRDRPARRQ